MGANAQAGRWMVGWPPVSGLTYRRNAKYAKERKYKGHDLRKAFRADLIVQDHLLVEVKSVDKPGVLLNVNESLPRNGIKRLANGF